MKKKCIETIEIFLSTRLSKVKFNAIELDNSSGGNKPMAWNIQKVKAEDYFNIFTMNDVNAVGETLNKINGYMKHPKLVGKITKYFKTANMIEDGEPLNQLLTGLDVSPKKKNESQEQYDKRIEQVGSTIRAGGIAFNQIVKAIEAEYNIQKNKALPAREDTKLSEDLKYKDTTSRVLSAMSLLPAIGRQISIATGYKAKTDGVLTDKQYYTMIGLKAVESLEAAGLVEILPEANIIDNDYKRLSGRTISRSNTTIKGMGIVLNLDKLVRKEGASTKTMENIKELEMLLETGSINGVKVQEEQFDIFNATYASSQMINTYTTPVNFLAPRTEKNFQKKKDKDKAEALKQLIITNRLGQDADGYESKGIPKKVVELFTGSTGLSVQTSMVNPVVDDIFMLMNQKLKKIFEKGNENIANDNMTLKALFESIGLKDQKDQAAIFGTFYKSIPDQIDSAIGQSISKENPLINLILNYETYKNGNPFVKQYLMYGTSRAMTTSTFLNEITGKFFDRAMIVGSGASKDGYTVKRNSPAFNTIIESLMDEFTSENMNEPTTKKNIKERLARRSAIENEGEDKGLDILVKQYEKTFIKNYNLIEKRVEDQVSFQAMLNNGYVSEDGVQYKINYKYDSVWNGLDFIGAVYDIRQSGEEVTLRYRTKPDATASGVVLTLLQAFGVNEESDKAIFNMLEKLQIARSEGSQIDLDEIYKDAYDIVEKAIYEEEQTLKERNSAIQSARSMIEEFTSIGLFKSMRDIIKPITMLTNYGAGRDSAIHGAAEEFADMLLNYMSKKAHLNQDKKTRRQALEKIVGMIKEADPVFYEANDIGEYLSDQNKANYPEIEISEIEGIRDVLITYFASDNGIAARLRDLQEAQFADATNAYKKKTSEMYAEIVALDKRYMGQGKYGASLNKDIIPAVTWHFINMPETNAEGFVTNEDHPSYKKENGKLIGKDGDVEKFTPEYRKWYAKMLKKYGMPITSKKQVVLNFGEKAANNPTDMLVLKDIPNALTALVNPIHGIDSAILLVSHYETQREMKQYIKEHGVDDPVSKEYMDALKQSSAMIYDANIANATYNTIYQRYYRKNTIDINYEYDVHEQLALLFDSYQENQDVMNGERIIYPSDTNKRFISDVQEKVEKKQKLMQANIMTHEDLMDNVKLFGFSDKHIVTNKVGNYLKGEAKTTEEKISEPERTGSQEKVDTEVDADEQFKKDIKAPFDERFSFILDGDHKYFYTGHLNKRFPSKNNIAARYKKHSEDIQKVVKSGKPFVVLDIENTYDSDEMNYKYKPGKDGAREEIIQMYAQKMQYKNGKLVPVGKPVEFKFKPSNFNGEEGYKKIVDGTDYDISNMVKNSETYTNEKVQKKLAEMLDELGGTKENPMPIIAYNGVQSDFRIMSQFDEIAKKLEEQYDIYDTRVLANWSLRNDDSVKRQGKNGEIWGRKQSEVADMFDVDTGSGKLHDASYDVKVMADIIEAIVNSNAIETGIGTKKARKEAKKTERKNKQKSHKKNQKTEDTGSQKGFDAGLDKKLGEILKKMYPDITLNYTVENIDGKEDIKGQANIEAKTVLINSLLQSQDTLPHEYAHHYIAMFRNAPIVQQAIKKWGSEEALVQAIGEQVVKQKGEAYGWWKKFSKWVRGLFSKYNKKELRNLLTDAFISNKNLNNEISIDATNVFNKNKKLQKIGTKVEYSSYVNELLANTTVNEILKHGTSSNFNTFDTKHLGRNNTNSEQNNNFDTNEGFFFTNKIENAAWYITHDKLNSITDPFSKENYEKETRFVLKDRDKLLKKHEFYKDYELGINYDRDIKEYKILQARLQHASETIEDKYGNIIYAIPNTKSLAVFDANYKKWKDNDKLKSKIIDFIHNNSDKKIIEYRNIVDPLLANSYLIRDIDSIVILGSDKDIEMFKEWKKNKDKNKNPNIFNQKEEKKVKDYDEKPQRRASKTLKEELAYDVDKTAHQVDLSNPLDVTLYTLNTNISDYGTNIGKQYIGPMAGGVLSKMHDVLYNNVDVYKMQYDRTVDYWESADWLQSMKGYLNTWGRFKNWHTLNQMATQTMKAAENRKYIEDTLIAKIKKLMHKYTDSEQEKIFEVMSETPVFWLVGEDKVLTEILDERNVDKDAVIDKWIQEYERRIGNKTKSSKIGRLAKILAHDIQPVPGVDVYNIEDLAPQTDAMRRDMGALLALRMIQNSEGHADILTALGKDKELSTELINTSVALKQATDETYKMTRDRKIFRDNMLFEQFDVPKDFEVVDVKDLNSNTYPPEAGWKILRSPTTKDYGLVYRDKIEATSQPGMGTSVRYKTADIMVPRDKYKPNAQNATTVYSGETKMHKLTLTKEELNKLKMIRNPGDTIVRAYGRIMEIRDTQAVRDEIVNQSMTTYIVSKEDMKQFNDKLADMDVKDRPVFLNIGDIGTAQELLEQYKNLGDKYTVVTGITSIGELNEKIHLVRKDAANMVIGYDDPVMFQNNEFLRKAMYTLRAMVKLTKIHWAIVNAGKIVGDTTSNMAILAAYGVPMQEMLRGARTSLKDLKSMEQLRIQLVDAELEKHAGHGSQAKINAIKKEIQDHPMAPMLNNGLLQSLSVEVMSKDESIISGLQNDVEYLLNKFLKDKDGKNNNFSKAIKGLSQMGWNIEDLLAYAGKGAKEFETLESFGDGLIATGDRIRTNKENGDMAKYLSEFIASPDSTAVRFGSALVQVIDIASRRILYDTMLSRGMKEKDVIALVTDAFIDYKLNMPKELKVLSDYGVLLFPSFWMRIQKVIYSTIKAAPATSAVGLALSNAVGMDIETILDSNMIYKLFGRNLDQHGFAFLNDPPIGLDTFLPTDIIGY